MKKSPGDKAFNVANMVVLTLLAAFCLAPFLHLVAVSFSSASAATSGRVALWPVEFTTAAYRQALKGERVTASLLMSLLRVLAGVGTNIGLLLLTAYPLSKSNDRLPGRSFFSWYFMITMLIGGGLIPTYLVVMQTGLLDTIWALVLPGAISAYNLTIVLNFFRGIPQSLEECALIDGANHIQILLKIFVPLSTPVIATMTIFCTVTHWNDWFSGLIYMGSQSRYPLMTYLQTIITTPDYSAMDSMTLEALSQVSNKTFQAAQILIATLPVLVIYPFCQKYFVTGLTLGSVKG